MIGSSMGGWIALLLARALARAARARKASIAGMVLIAPAVDFTEELMWKQFSADDQARDRGRRACGCGPRNTPTSPIRSPAALIEEGRKHLLLGGLIEPGCPVRILQGVQDPDVPWQHAVELVVAPRARRRGAHAGQGRRPPPVAAGGHRAADRGGGGILNHASAVVHSSFTDASFSFCCCASAVNFSYGNSRDSRQAAEEAEFQQHVGASRAPAKRP